LDMMIGCFVRKKLWNIKLSGEKIRGEKLSQITSNQSNKT